MFWIGIPGCGGVFTSNEGELYSPSVKGQYPPDLICEYKIQVLEQSRIKITFLKFDLEEDEECYYDYLEVNLLIFQRNVLTIVLKDTQ